MSILDMGMGQNPLLQYHMTGGMNIHWFSYDYIGLFVWDAVTIGLDFAEAPDPI